MDCSLLVCLASFTRGQDQDQDQGHGHGRGTDLASSTDKLANALRICTKCSALLQSSDASRDAGLGSRQRSERHSDQVAGQMDAFLLIVDQLKSKRHLLDIQYDLYLESLASSAKLASPLLAAGASPFGVSLDRLMKLRKGLLELFSDFEKLLLKLQSIEMEVEAETGSRAAHQFGTLVRNVRLEYSMYLQELMLSLPFLPKQQEKEKKTPGCVEIETDRSVGMNGANGTGKGIETDGMARLAMGKSESTGTEKNGGETSHASSSYFKNWLPSLASFGDAMALPLSSAREPPRPASPLTSEQRSILEMQLSLLQTNLKESVRTRQLDAVQPLREAIQDIRRALGTGA